MINKIFKYMFNKRTLPFFISLTITTMVEAQLINGKTLQVIQPDDIASQITPGSILILGENHGLMTHRDQHLILLNLLKAKGLKVSVGLEFVNYTDQQFVDQYTNGSLTEDQFLKAIGWQGIDFQFYKEQLLFPHKAEGFSLGLNIPRFVTSKIAKLGLEGLSDEDKKLVPPQFHVGRDSYKKRFADIMHVPAGPQLDRYFLAQSMWDDTMAWRSTQFTKAHPEQVLVIVIGEFHAQYGGGLADRIRYRDPTAKIKILSQIWAVKTLDDGQKINYSAEEIQNEIKPSETEGPRGDFIWISKLPSD